jgi:hypothetical protein
VQLLEILGQDGDQEASVVKMMILLKHKIVKSGEIKGMEFKEEIAVNKQNFYDIFKNPSYQNTVNFFKDPLVQTLWRWYINNNYFKACLRSLDKEQASVLKVIAKRCIRDSGMQI